MTKTQIKEKIKQVEDGLEVTTNPEDKEILKNNLAKLKKMLAELEKTEPAEKPAEPKKEEKKEPAKKEEPKAEQKKEPEKKQVLSLKDFNLDHLDQLERRMYEHHVESMSKEQALQVLINTVEGDYSQLDPHLAEFAESQEKEDAKKEEPKKEEPKKEEPKKEEPKKEPKPAIASPSDNLTASELQRIKEVYGVFKKANYVIVKRKNKPDQKVTRVKPHSQSYKHAQRIIENVPAVFRPATMEISKSDKKEKNKGLIKEVDKMKDFLTIIMNDLDLMILTENESHVKTINNWLIDLIKKAHQNDFSFKYEGRAAIKELAKKHPELSIVKFADGGCILD